MMADKPTLPLVRQVEVVNELGLHARSAAKIAAAASAAVGGIRLFRDGVEADATSIIDMLTLACAKGTRLTVEAGDAADSAVLDAIVELFAQGFGE